MLSTGGLSFCPVDVSGLVWAAWLVLMSGNISASLSAVLLVQMLYAGRGADLYIGGRLGFSLAFSFASLSLSQSFWYTRHSSLFVV